MFQNSLHDIPRGCGEMTQCCTHETGAKMYNTLFDIISEGLVVTGEELDKAMLNASRSIRRACRAALTTIDSCGSAVADRLSKAVLDEAGTIPEAKLSINCQFAPNYAYRCHWGPTAARAIHEHSAYAQPQDSRLLSPSCPCHGGYDVYAQCAVSHTSTNL